MNEQTKTIAHETQHSEEFIMLPTVDFCFKELMQNAKVRQGLIAALLGIEPEEIEETILLPTVLHTDYPDEKYGILDFIQFPNDDRCYRKIIFCDKDTGDAYTDLMEIHVLELSKLPEEDKNEAGIIRWMRFLGAKSRKEFEKMAKEDSYMGEAFEALKHMSADEKKRMEYEAREKAIRDYNSQMESAKKEGHTEGREAERIEVARRMLKSHKLSYEEVAGFTELTVEEVKDFDKISGNYSNKII